MRWVGKSWDHICPNKAMVKCSYKKCGMNVYIDRSENLLLHLKGVIEYVLPKPNEKFCVNSSTDENDSSEKGDFELTKTEKAVHHVEAPQIPKHWRQVWTFCYNSFFFREKCYVPYY